MKEYNTLDLTLEQLYAIKDLGYTLDDYLFTHFSFLGDRRYLAFTPKRDLVGGGKPTSKGFELLKTIQGMEEGSSKTKLTGENKKAFEALWELYPADNGTAKFPATRLTRGNRELAMKHYLKLLNEHTALEIMQGTKMFLEKSYESSITRNELEYLPNLSRFLEEKRFLNALGSSLMDKLVKPSAPPEDIELL